MLDIWLHDHAPPHIAAARPDGCPGCGSPAVVGGKIVLHGHGLRQRWTVLPGPTKALFLAVWARRFRCTACRGTTTVLPPGVVHRHLYSLYAILTAWWLASARPVGEGLDDAEVYARQGVDRGLAVEAHHYGRPRWRSLPRWARRSSAWWPARVVSAATWRSRVHALVAGWTVLGDDWRDHAVRGAAM
jgi:transposase